MSNTKEDTVQFSKEQYMYLEKMFPERVLQPTVPDNEVRHYFGQRSVMEVIRRKTRNI